LRFITVLTLLFMSGVSWSDELAVSRLFSDESEVTHFTDDSLTWNTLNTPDGNLPVTDLLPAEEIGFLRLPSTYRSDWHPAPRKQYVMVLIGSMEVEAGDGEKRVFRPGSVLLVTDTEGRGHKTNVVGGEEVLLVWVPIP